MEHFIFKLKPKDYIKILKFFKLKKKTWMLLEKKYYLYFFKNIKLF